MSLADTLTKARAAAKRTPRCGLRQVMDDLPPADHDALVEALEDKSCSGAAVARALKDEGFSVSPFTINRHRRLDCSCYPGGK